jgi:cystathionine beta-lyase/cystathionine gamma-synthase
MAARLAYYDGIRRSFAVSTGMGAIATLAAIFVKSKGLQRSSGP